MEKTSAPNTSTTPTKGGTQSPVHAAQVSAAKQAFIGSALSMSWQLAAVVLVPIIGGFKLDEHLNTAPLLTIVGFVLATIGMSLVLWRQLQQLSPVIPSVTKEKQS